jgi:hypothetical protein
MKSVNPSCVSFDISQVVPIAAVSAENSVFCSHIINRLNKRRLLLAQRS